MSGVRPANHDWTQLSRGFCGDRVGAGSVVRGECGRVASFGGHHGRGGSQTPAYHLLRPV